MQYGDEHYRDIPDILLAYLERGQPQFDSVICGNDRIAFMVYQTLLTRGSASHRILRFLGTTTS